jgi:transcriptional regulator with XRE-family HTH domain
MAGSDCPNCGSSQVVPVLRGLRPTDQDRPSAGDGSVALHDGFDDWVCGDCGNRWPNEGTGVLPGIAGNGDRSTGATRRAPQTEAPDLTAGPRLREAREERGLTLTQAATATKIWANDLMGLEQDAPPSTFEGLSYARFSLREYAEYLGLDPDPIVRDYVARHATEEEPEELLELLPDPRGGVKVLGRALTMLSLVAIVALSVLTSVRGGSGSDVAPDRATGTATQGLVIERDLGTAPIQPRRPVPAPDVRRVRAVLLVSARSWVEAIADGRTVVRRTLAEGERMTLRAQRVLLLTLGNAGGVSLRVNGDPVPTGGPGEVVHVTFHLRDGELVSRPGV